jgi:chemosensory pili system protein ChpA (sensor histidine kinase/response regulator)
MAKKVAIVDDNMGFLEELSSMLRENGYAVYPFSDGKSALDDIPSILPDIVLLDLKMDKISGFQVADRLKYSAKTKNIPMIAMTGYYSQKEYDDAIKICGMRRCILKPFSPDKILSEIAEVIKENRAGE